MNKWVKIVVPAAVAALVSACGGGGGGGGTSATVGSLGRPTAVPTGTTQRLQGSSHEARYTSDSSTNQVTAVGPVSTFGPTATAQYTTDSTGNLTDISFTSASGTNVNFSRSAGDAIGVHPNSNALGIAASGDQDKVALFAMAGAMGWQYQTFGIWGTGNASNSGTAGAFSVGNQTVAAAIPTTGTATYNGATTGWYVDGFNNVSFTTSDLSIAANFGNRTLAFSTTNTLASSNLRIFTQNDSLNMSGTLTYAAGVNQFSGPVTTNSGMRGTARGQFYGPNAEEIGGGFEARAGSGNMSYIGSFGGKR